MSFREIALHLAAQSNTRFVLSLSPYPSSRPENAANTIRYSAVAPLKEPFVISLFDIGLGGCFILFGDAVVFLQISFGASEVRQGHRLSVGELGFVVFPRYGVSISSIFILEGILHFI